MKGGTWWSLSSGKSEIFWDWGELRSLRHLTQLRMWRETDEVPPIIQYPCDLISLRVVVRPWCRHASWKCWTSSLVMWPSLGNMIGNLVSSFRSVRLRRPPTRRTPSLSRKGSSFCSEVTFLGLLLPWNSWASLVFDNTLILSLKAVACVALIITVAAYCSSCTVREWRVLSVFLLRPLGPSPLNGCFLSSTLSFKIST